MSKVIEAIEGLPLNISEIILPMESISFNLNLKVIYPFLIEILDTSDVFKEKIKKLLQEAISKHGGALLVSRGLSYIGNDYLNSHIAVFGFNENILYDAVTPIK